MSDDLVAWLREQIDEDERVARAAMEPNDEGGCGPHWTVGNGAGGVDSPEGPIYYQDGGIPTSAQDEHIASHDPARVLREVEAKRRLLVQFELRGNSVRATVQPSTGGVWDDLLRLLALPYADRPGYREEWRP